MFKSYKIEARLKFPSCFHNGYDFEVVARNKKDAISKARRQVFLEGHSSRIDGAMTYVATEIEDGPALPSELIAPQVTDPATVPNHPRVGELCRNGAPVYYVGDLEFTDKRAAYDFAMAG